MVCGLVVIAFGLYFLGIIKINLFHGAKNPLAGRQLGFFSSVLFGVIFSFGWTPCVGRSSARRSCWPRSRRRWHRASFCFCATRPASAFRLWRPPCSSTSWKGAFTVIKQHYDIINKVCGWFLVAVGVLMATGLLGGFLRLLS